MQGMSLQAITSSNFFSRAITAFAPSQSQMREKQGAGRSGFWEALSFPLEGVDCVEAPPVAAQGLAMYLGGAGNLSPYTAMTHDSRIYSSMD